MVEWVFIFCSMILTSFIRLWKQLGCWWIKLNFKFQQKDIIGVLLTWWCWFGSSYKLLCHCIHIMSMKTMKTNDESTYLSLKSKTKWKQTTSLNTITQILQTKVNKINYYDKIWKYQPKNGINITTNIVLCNHLICK